MKEAWLLTGMWVSNWWSCITHDRQRAVKRMLMCTHELGETVDSVGGKSGVLAAR